MSLTHITPVTLGVLPDGSNYSIWKELELNKIATNCKLNQHSDYVQHQQP